MSNYHLMEAGSKLDQVRAAFHIFVPDEVNSMGINLRTAIAQHLAPDSSVPFIQAAERADIQAGNIYERIEWVRFAMDLTVPEKRTIIDARFTALNAIIPNRIREIYRFWGLDRDVP